MSDDHITRICTLEAEVVGLRLLLAKAAIALEVHAEGVEPGCAKQMRQVALEAQTEIAISRRRQWQERLAGSPSQETL